jgi:hypothetical protein
VRQKNGSAWFSDGNLIYPSILGLSILRPVFHPTLNYPLNNLRLKVIL